MQTTGLFSSSSPQQANVGGGSSLIGTLGAALVLVFGVVLLTGLSLDRTQTAMVRFPCGKRRGAGHGRWKAASDPGPVLGRASGCSTLSKNWRIGLTCVLSR